ncbi:hypothetical protein KF840_18990 [bacterium]|nr:hypothetical protein [bacterium]
MSNHVPSTRRQAAAEPPPALAEPQSSDARATTQRVFVVRVSPDCSLAPGDFRGRVQHLSSIDGGNFSSMDGLIAIMRRILACRAGESGLEEADE